MKRRLVQFLILTILAGLVPVSVFEVEKAEAATATFDLSSSSRYNIRFDGATASDQLGLNGPMTADLNNNGKDDLIMTAPTTDFNSRSNSGSVYIVYDSLIDDYSGTGNNVDLSDTSKFNIRIDGPVATAMQGTYRDPVTIADLNNNGKNDLIIAMRGSDYNSRTDSGSVYVLLDSFLGSYTSTGHILDLADTSAFNLRIDGAAASDGLGNQTGYFTGDLNNDGKNELTLGSASDFNSRSNSGSLYILNNDLISSYTTTGNTLDLSTTWSLRIDGASASDFFGSTLGPNVADLDANGMNDLTVGSFGTDYTASGAGSVYFFLNSLLNVSGSNLTLDTATSSNYTLRVDGPSTSDAFAYQPTIRDLNGDGYPDFTGASFSATYSGRSSAGIVWVISGTLLRNYYTSTGNTLAITDTTGYSVRIVGVATSDQLGFGGYNVANYLGTGNDIIVGANAADNNGDGSGSVWLISNALLKSNMSSEGNTLDLTSSSNYSVRVDGPAAGARLIASNNGRGDMNNDGRSDFVITSYLGNNSRASSGSIYLIYNFPHTLTVNESRIDTSNTNPRITGSLTTSNSTTTISDVQYSLSSADPSSSSWTSCTAADGSFNGSSESFTCALSFSSDATHNVFIRAKDSYGAYTLGSAYRSLPLTVDRVSLPTFSINAQQYSNDGSVLVNGTYNDDRSGLDKIVTKGIGTGSVVAGLNGASWSVTYANVPDGIYQLSAISYDRAGNEKSVTAGNTTTVDRNAPTLTATATNLTDKNNSSTVEQGVTIEGSVSDGYAGLKSVVLTNETTNSTIPLKVTNSTYKSDITLRKGTNTLKVVATDNAGNTSTQTLSIVRNSFISGSSKDIPITDEKGITKKYKQADVLAGLKQGKTNVFVRSLQDSLKTLGHYTGNITGFFGELTKKAIIAFQKSVGIKQTGTVQAQTLARLDVTKITDDAYLSSIAQSKPGLSKDELKAALSYQLKKDLASGKQDEEIKFIQKKLYALGYYSGAINGWLNTSTQVAINEFRKGRGLGAGGVDSKLREKLNSL